MKVIARKVDTRLMVEIFIDWTFRILLNSFSTDYFLNLRDLLSSFLNKPKSSNWIQSVHMQKTRDRMTNGLALNLRGNINVCYRSVWSVVAK